MALLVVVGILLLNLTANGNITSAKEKASIEQDIYSAQTILHSLSSLEVYTVLGTLPLSEALNAYYNLKIRNNLNKSERRLRDDLEVQIRTEVDNLINKPVLIKSDIYKDKLSLYEEITLYDDVAVYKPAYIKSVILPSSYSRAGDYYINISLYYNDRAYAENEK
jgi:hypothetical protein